MESKPMTKEDLVVRIASYVESDKGLMDDVYKVASGVGDVLTLDYSKIDVFDHHLAHWFLEYPMDALKLFRKCIKAAIIDYDKDASPYYFLSVVNIPEHRRRRVNTIKASDRYKLTTLEGTVRLINTSRPKVMTAVFICRECDSYKIVRVGIDNKVRVPMIDCDHKQNTRLSPERSVYEDTQFIDVQDDFVNPGSMQNVLHILLTGPLVNSITAGSKVEIVGVPHLDIKGNYETIDAYSNMFFYALSINHRERTLGDIEITKEDEIKLREMANSPTILRTLARSMAPSIKGHEIIKTALVLQQIQGVSRKLKDGTQVRATIHGMLAGEPGLAKSKLLLYISTLLKGVYTTAKTSSGAGLTAAAKQETGPSGSGQWVLTAGALPLADLGTCCIDEWDKMPQDQQDSLLCAMENGSFPFNKADIATTLYARCNVLGACNPKEGRYNRDLSLASNLDITPPMLSRFDFIFHIIDDMDLIEWEEIATHIIKLHAGEVEEIFSDVLDIDTMRKYLFYAQKLRPKIPAITQRYLNTTCLEFRRKSDENIREISITPRQLESITRLSIASAKAHLRDNVLKSDVDIAVMIFEAYLASVSGVMPGEDFSIDSIMCDISPARRRTIDIVTAYLKGSSGKQRTKKQIYRHVKSEDKSINDEDIAQAITWLLWKVDEIQAEYDEVNKREVLWWTSSKR